MIRALQYHTDSDSDLKWLAKSTCCNIVKHSVNYCICSGINSNEMRGTLVVTMCFLYSGLVKEERPACAEEEKLETLNIETCLVLIKRGSLDAFLSFIPKPTLNSGGIH